VLQSPALAVSAVNFSYLLSAGDVNSLNYYIFLKNFEVAFYDKALLQFNGTAYSTAGYYTSTVTYITTMRDQAAVMLCHKII
jgi:hypothetical protein